MSYFLMAMIVAFGALFIPAFLGSMITKKHIGRTVTLAGIASVLYGLVLWFLYWSGVYGVYGPTPFLASIVIGCIFAGVLAYFAEGEETKAIIPAFAIAAGYLLYMMIVVLVISQSDMFNSTGKAKLIGEVEIVTDLEKTMKPADTSHICLVSRGMAKVAAQNALSKFKVSDDVIPGSRYEIGHETRQYVDGQVWWIFPVEFQGWLKWKQDKQVPGYLRVSAEDPFAEGQAVQVNKLGEEISIEYLNSACFEYQAERYLRNNGFMGTILKDWTFEADDNWNPYYTVSIVERTYGYFGYKTVGVLVFNLQTGEFKVEKMDELPSWIDRATPLDVIDYNVDKWGEYSKEGWWYCLWHDDKSQEQTEGWYLTYDAEGGCQWFTGFTSKSTSDEALTGFMVANARTGKAKFFKATGVVEAVAYKTAKSLWSNYEGYTPTVLAPYNIYSVLTYVIPMEYAGQFKGVSLVSMQNVNIKAKGETLEEALSNYRACMAEAGQNRLTPSGGEMKVVQLEGEIDRIGKSMMRGKRQVFPFTLKGVSKIFEAVYGYDTPKVSFMKPGDKVVVIYIETLEQVITCKEFDIPMIVLTDESPAQAQYLESQKEVNAETERIEKHDKKQRILKGDDIKDVDPDALEKFIKEQKKRE